MKLNEFSQDEKLDEILPVIGAVAGGLARGAAAVGGAALRGGAGLAKGAGQALAKGAQAVGGAVKAGAQAAGQATASAAPDPKALAMAAMQAKERKDNITQQMKDIDTTITDLQKQKSELQKELATVK
jgi:hypothetical protein